MPIRPEGRGFRSAEAIGASQLELARAAVGANLNCQTLSIPAFLGFRFDPVTFLGRNLPFVVHHPSERIVVGPDNAVNFAE